MKPRLRLSTGRYAVFSIICTIFVRYFIKTGTCVESPFSSLPKIKIIWDHERKNINLMEKIIEEMKHPPKDLHA